MRLFYLSRHIIGLLVIAMLLSAIGAPYPHSALAAPGSRVAEQATGSGRISGRVTAADTGAGLGSVSVLIYNANGGFVASANTDATGLYTSTALLATGTYRVEFNPRFSSNTTTRTYLGEFYNDKPDLTSADGVSVTSPNTTANINAVLARGGQISGRVTAADTGAGLEGVTVRVYYVSGASLTSVTTSATGAYTITGLFSDSYVLEFAPPSSGTASNYLGEYYNDQVDLKTATIVAVSAPNATSGVDAVLTRGGQISGRVTGEGGVGLRGVRVTVYDACGLFLNSASTDTTGVYTTGVLAGGGYRLYFDPSLSSDATVQTYLKEYYNDKASLTAADLVTVTASTLTPNIDAQLTRGTVITGTGRISGRVSGESDVALDDVLVEVYDSNGRYIVNAFTNATGAYTTTLLPVGTYRLYFDPSTASGTTAAYLGEYYNDKASLSAADAVAVISGTVTPNINAQLARGGQISGRVTGEGGVPLENVDVTVYTSANTSVASVDTDATGTYTTSGLAAGQYRVEFDPRFSSTSRLYVSEYYNDKASLSTADPVAVTLGSVTPNINAQLVRGGQISGRVTGEGGVPLAGVEVSVYDSNGSNVVDATTSATGVYTASSLKGGSYRVGFSTSSARSFFTYQHVGEYYNDKVSLAAADPVTVTLGAAVLDINAQLVRGGLIRGRVTANGCPVFATVIVWPPTGSALASTTTGTRGYYLTPAVPGGSYAVEFDASSSYRDEFYNDKLSRSTADLVAVTPPNITDNINADLINRSQQKLIFQPLILR